jgi:type IV secretion system protein VirB9
VNLVRSARMMTALSLVVATGVVSGVACAAVVPSPGRTDARVREIEYREDQVVQLTGYVGYHIDIELERGEQFVALGAGDSAAVDVASEGPHVMVKPKAARVATNLTLVSSRRVYHFEYRSLDAQPPLNTAIFALRFRYSPAPSGVTPAATPVPFSSQAVTAAAAARLSESSSVTPGPAGRPVNRDYWYCGGSTLQPVAASDDGVQTRLTFSSRGEWPAIFVRNEDGSESLLNFHAEGTTAVVHRVAPEFVLRRGRLVGCVENRGYAGSGNWVSGGALESTVSREVRP